MKLMGGLGRLGVRAAGVIVGQVGRVGRVGQVGRVGFFGGFV